MDDSLTVICFYEKLNVKEIDTIKGQTHVLGNVYYPTKKHKLDQNY